MGMVGGRDGGGKVREEHPVWAWWQEGRSILCGHGRTEKGRRGRSILCGHGGRREEASCVGMVGERDGGGKEREEHSV